MTDSVMGKEVDELRKKQVGALRRRAIVDNQVIKAQTNLINKLADHMEELSDVALDFPAVERWIKEVALPEKVTVTRVATSVSVENTISVYWGKPDGRFLLFVYGGVVKLKDDDLAEVELEVKVSN